KNQLRIIRNSIYALHGYSFKSEDLKTFFEINGESWYPAYNERVKNGFSEKALSNIEKKNIEIILEEEKKR
ncbi:MAG: YARHG domain-containing protein, partial [Treponema sp.]|nr:YARHG domain-containing protein [Treponema sp.]